MSFKDKLDTTEERMEYISRHIMELEDVKRRPGIGALLQKHIDNTFSAFDDARMHNDEESARRAVDMAEMFTVMAQTMGISNMRLFNKEAHKQRADASEKVARLDALTQSGNRLAFSEQIKTLVRQQDKDPEMHSAVILFDLDRFKGLNDTYGHAAGDAGLQAFAEKLKSITRHDGGERPEHENRASDKAVPSDNLFTPRTADADAAASQAEYRFGGDEFALTLQVRADSAEQAEQMLRSIEARIKDNLSAFSFEYDGQVFPLVSSAGMHILNADDTAESACEKADEALFAHKESKSLRYAESVQALEETGADNIAVVPDPRADERLLLRQAKIGAAVQSLSDAGAVEIRVPEGAEPDALSALEEAGVTVKYSDPENGQDADPHTPA